MQTIAAKTVRQMRSALLALAILAIFGFAMSVRADSDTNSKVVGNVAVYMGMLPVEMIRGYSPRTTEGSMHGGKPKGRDGYHIVVALFDAKSGTRITHANIRARVSEIGYTGEEKALQPMEIAGTETYGNYFSMVGDGPFRIPLVIRVPGEKHPIELQFEHRHQ